MRTEMDVDSRLLPYLPYEGEQLDGRDARVATYVATLVNPVDRRPTMVVCTNKYTMIGMPVDALEDFEVLGQGWFDVPSALAKAFKRCSRSHTDAGVLYRGVGHGLMLYAGMAMTVEAAVEGLITKKVKGIGKPKEGCIASPRGGRSDDAEAFWERQRQVGLARVEPVTTKVHAMQRVPLKGRPDLGKFGAGPGLEVIEARYVSSGFEVTIRRPVDEIFARDIRQSGLILDDLAGTDLPPTEILLRLDMRASRSARLMKRVLDTMKERGVDRELRSRFFRNNVSAYLLTNEDEMVDGARRNNDYWSEFYGPLTTPDN
jgi:hypothetical protein